MKNAMKRVMSILLVAMLLVSALPLAASAKSLMDNLNALPGQETKPTQPAPVVPVVTEAPAAPVATEAPAAPAAPAAASTFALSRESRGGTEQTYGPLYVYFFDEDDLDTPITAVGENGKCTYNGGPATGPTLISEFLDAKFPGMYEFVRIQSGGVSSTSTDYVANIQDAHYDVIVKKNTPITMNVYIDDVLLSTRDFYGTYTGNSMLSAILPNWSASYVQTYGGEDNTMVNLAASYKGGQRLYVYLTAKGSSTTTPSSSTTPSASTTPSGSTSATETTEYYNKFPYNVYLNIYKDTMVGAPDKTINITKGAAIDGTVTMDEVKALVMNHYKAKDSYGISFDGLYLAEGTWVTNYVTDTQKYDKFIDVDTFRQYRTVYINVMIDNATAKSSSSGTAETSNPKTGDSIYAPIAVLGVSATALAAAMFFYNKKRLAK